VFKWWNMSSCWFCICLYMCSWLYGYNLFNNIKSLFNNSMS